MGRTLCQVWQTTVSLENFSEVNLEEDVVQSQGDPEQHSVTDGWILGSPVRCVFLRDCRIYSSRKRELGVGIQRHPPSSEGAPAETRPEVALERQEAVAS